MRTQNEGSLFFAKPSPLQSPLVFSLIFEVLFLDSNGTSHSFIKEVLRKSDESDRESFAIQYSLRGGEEKRSYWEGRAASHKGF